MYSISHTIFTGDRAVLCQFIFLFYPQNKLLLKIIVNNGGLITTFKKWCFKQTALSRQVLLNDNSAQKLNGCSFLLHRYTFQVIKKNQAKIRFLGNPLIYRND